MSMTDSPNDDPSPFLTTSDVLKSLNKALSDLKEPGEQNTPSFELQRRLPDGSSRRATERELAAADMETKLKQTAAFLATLETWEQKVTWAEAQRKKGNDLFTKARYEEAIDVYLTCLTVTEHEDDSGDHLLFYKVMNNLAQAALQLKWYNKTIHFCNLSLDRVQKLYKITKENASSTQKLQTAKLYFKRAKSRRLLGVYNEASKDLQESLRWLESDIEDDYQEIASSRRAIEKELFFVSKATEEAKKNKERQEKAMKRVLGETGGTSNTTKEKPEGRLYSETKTPRTFSKVRAPKKTVPDDEKEDELQELSYLEYYRLIIGRVAEQLLTWLEDEDDAGIGPREKNE